MQRLVYQRHAHQDWDRSLRRPNFFVTAHFVSSYRSTWPNYDARSVCCSYTVCVWLTLSVSQNWRTQAQLVWGLGVRSPSFLQAPSFAIDTGNQCCRILIRASFVYIPRCKLSSSCCAVVFYGARQSTPKAKRFGHLPASYDSFDQLCANADEKLFFFNVRYNPNHVLHQLLPSVKCSGYNLRSRRHNYTP